MLGKNGFYSVYIRTPPFLYLPSPLPVRNSPPYSRSMPTIRRPCPSAQPCMGS